MFHFTCDRSLSQSGESSTVKANADRPPRKSPWQPQQAAARTDDRPGSNKPVRRRTVPGVISGHPDRQHRRRADRAARRSAAAAGRDAAGTDRLMSSIVGEPIDVIGYVRSVVT